MFQKINDLETPQIYHHLVHAVVPRPIAWVSTLNKAGVSNISPYSFFSVASVNPPVLTVTSVPTRDKLVKDTHQNLLETKECVVNIVTEELADMMNASCANYPAGTSEIDALGIPILASELVKPLGVAQAKVRFECQLRETIELTNKPAGGILILLDVIGIHVDESISTGQQIDGSKLNAIGKLGGNDYCKLRDQISIDRPA